MAVNYYALVYKFPTPLVNMSFEKVQWVEPPKPLTKVLIHIILCSKKEANHPRTVVLLSAEKERCVRRHPLYLATVLL